MNWSVYNIHGGVGFRHSFVDTGSPVSLDLKRDATGLLAWALEELASRGIYTCCLTLDPEVDNYLSRIFGLNDYSIVGNVEPLPERPLLFFQR